MNIDLPRAVIFDWDNTLVDSWDAIAKAVNMARARYGKTTWSMPEIKANCTRAARDSFPEWFGEKWQDAYNYYYRCFDEVRKSSRIESLPGAEELLRTLGKKNIPSLVVSNKHGNYLRLEVERLGWNDFFSAIVGAQDTPNDKPARDPVDFALGKINLAASQDVWFVGDSEIDMQCARNAGCTPVWLGDSENAARLSVAYNFFDCKALHMKFL